VRPGLAPSLAVIVCLCAILAHAFRQETLADTFGVGFFLLLVASAFTMPPGWRPRSKTQTPDALRDQRLYDDFYLDHGNDLSFESLSKVDVFEALVTRFSVQLRGASLCDLGFGSGLILEKAREMGARISGVELSQTAVDRVRTLFPGADVRCNSADSTTFEDHSFDIVVSSNVLEHIENELPALGEIRRLLSSNGVAIVGVPSRDSAPDPRHFRVYERDDLSTKMESAGLKPNSWLSIGSRLVHVMTPRLPFDVGGSSQVSRPKSRLVSIAKFCYYRCWVPALRKLYVASARSGDTGFVNEIWTLARPMRSDASDKPG